MEFCGEFARLVGGGSVGAAHVAGQADDDGLDFLPRDHPGDVLDRVARFRLHGFQRVGEHAEFVREGEPDARFANINAKDTGHGRKLA